MKKYQVTRLFTKGTLKGLTHTEITSVQFEVGKTYKNSISGADYKIIECIEMNEEPSHMTIWQQLENGHWVLVRTRPAQTAKRLVKEYNEVKMEVDRHYDCFPVDVNPNQKSA
jgi:hypothetical protein